MQQAHRLSARLRWFRFACDRVGSGWTPGDKIMLRVSNRARRAYTLCAVDPDRDEFEVVAIAHGAGPGGVWAGQLAVGDTTEFQAPKRDVDIRIEREGTVVLLGDETALGLFAGVGARAPETAALIGAVEHPAHVGNAHRTLSLNLEAVGGDPAHPGGGLLAWLQRTPFVPRDAHYIVCGHRTVVRRIAGELTERGVHSERVRARTYWS
ncbi:MAG: siderophore-interacting protein [Nannocystaceae bacterium]|nr:siderophore-interacting protein [Nannocystaceae bacterium]